MSRLTGVNTKCSPLSLTLILPGAGIVLINITIFLDFIHRRSMFWWMGGLGGRGWVWDFVDGEDNIPLTLTGGLAWQL